MIASGEFTASEFPDFDKETGYKPATSAFIDGVEYDGSKPNAYISAMKIGLKGSEKP